MGFEEGEELDEWLAEDATEDDWDEYVSIGRGKVGVKGEGKKQVRKGVLVEHGETERGH